MNNIIEKLQRARKVKNETEMDDLLNIENIAITLELILSGRLKLRHYEILKGHENSIVRHELAKSKKCGVQILKYLTSDKEMIVRDYAKRTLTQFNKG